MNSSFAPTSLGETALESLGTSIPARRSSGARKRCVAVGIFVPAPEITSIAGCRRPRSTTPSTTSARRPKIPGMVRSATATSQRKIGRHLKLFDCLTCDICVPVCPNDANFTFSLEEAEIPITKLRRSKAGWEWRREGTLQFEERHQIGNLADFCNDCGNCDVFCPEDGGPYVMKPRFFRREADWLAASELDGFQLERRGAIEVVRGRFNGKEFVLETEKERMFFSGDDFRLELSRADPAGSVVGDGPEEVDLTYCFIMDALRRAMFDTTHVNYINSLAQIAPQNT